MQKKTTTNQILAIAISSCIAASVQAGDSTGIAAPALSPIMAVEGSACLGPGGVSATGAVAFASTGKILSCQSGMWRRGDGIAPLADAIGLPSWWPSYIRCAGGANYGERALPLGFTDGVDVHYFNNAGTAVIARFDINGAFKSHSYATTCANKSIQQLITEGKAFY